MPRYSAFTRYGHLFYSSRPPVGQLFYRQIVNSLGGNYDVTIGSRAEARIFATAMLLARAKLGVLRAANQMDPRRVLELLPVYENKYGIVPGLLDDVFTREVNLAAKRQLPLGARITAVTNALSAAVGSGFLFYYVTKRADIHTFPASPGAGPGNWVKIGTPIKIVRLTGPVTGLGGPVAVGYAQVLPGENLPIGVGDQLVVSTNNIGIAERVSVTAATSTTFTATFAGAHDPGDVCTTAPFPYWISNQEHVLVIVTPAAARDAESIRKINQVMEQVSRTWAVWTIAPSTDGVHTDAFTIDDPTLGFTDNAAIESVTFP